MTTPPADPTPIRAVVFDLDGVLVDTEPWWHEARVAVAGALGGSWTVADESGVKGANSREWAAAMIACVGRVLPPDLDAARVEAAVVDEMVVRYGREHPPTIEAGGRAVERLADRFPLAVASSAHARVIDAALAALGISTAFRVVLSSDAVGAGKPAPDVYREAARRLGVATSGCLVIEDSLAGVRAAHAAGMRVVLVPAAGHPPAPGAKELATLVLASLDELDDDRLADLAAIPPPVSPPPAR
jgi:beta-phosphoglucomutase-like phosphatase (HAD superfamily)